MTTPSMLVKSHVARDLEQAGALFKTDKLVIWEYVVNSLQYVDPGVSPVVRVTLDSKGKKIIVSDNGRGMDGPGLQNFFIMHGENEDRKQGKTGRGNFGTGKSAAFGIGDTLRISTVRNHKRSCVELCRRDLHKMGSGDPVPLKVLEYEVATREPNGTVIEIEDIHLRSFDQAGIIKYLERHLAHARKDATVLVNNHECEYSEPAINDSQTIHPEGVYGALGGVALTIKVAKASLEPDLRGIAIYSNGVWHETTMAGSEGKDMSQYIFGEVDVPALDADTSPIRPFDMSRSMTLNPTNELVQLIYGFIGENVELIRKGLAESERQRRLSEDSRRLSQEGSKIAELLNEDFEQFRNKFARVRAKGKGSFDSAETEQLQAGSTFLFPNGEAPAEETGVVVDPPHGDGHGGKRKDTIAPDTALLRPSSGGKPIGGSPAGTGANKKSRAGGFSVDFKNHGETAARAKYDSEDRTIYINLDHPQITAAKGLGERDDPNFRRLTYEVAFAEYAIALAQELANEGQYVDLTDPIVEIRDSINRLARRAASLYAC